MDNLRFSEEEIASLIRPDKGARSRIANFYESRSVFITGGTGFVGKILIEKLLRACENLERIYVLVRSKKNKNPGERLRELLQSTIYDGVRQEKLLAKVVPIEGDVTQPMLGICDQDLELLAKNVSIVFHSAAAIGFELPIKRAVESNLTGVYNVIQFALKLTDLQALVYVSSAYANSNRSSKLDEHIYPVNVDPETLIEMAASFDEETMELIKRSLVGDHRNTYTYTKSLAEWLCGVYANRLPIAICRPSVITCTWREPIPGYLDNYSAANGLYTYISGGLLRCSLGNGSVPFDHIPVDTVINCIIVNAWFAHLYHGFIKKTIQFDDNGSSKEYSPSMAKRLARFQGRTRRLVLQKGISESVAGDLPVFHCSSSVERPIKLAKFTDLMVKYANEYPSQQLFRTPNFSYTKSIFLHKWNSFWGHQTAARSLDLLNKYLGDGKSNWLVQMRRGEALTRVIAYFLLKQWKFNPDNRLALIEDFMSEEDRRLFDCDIKPIEWNKYARNYSLGIRRFIFKEPLEELPEARRHLRMIYWRNTMIQVSSALILCLMIYLIF